MGLADYEVVVGWVKDNALEGSSLAEGALAAGGFTIEVDLYFWCWEDWLRS